VEDGLTRCLLAQTNGSLGPVKRGMVPAVRAARAAQAAFRAEASIEPGSEPPLLCWPLDHFYSPIPDNRVLAQEPTRSRLYQAVPQETPGIDWREGGQVEFMPELGEQGAAALAGAFSDGGGSLWIRRS